MAPPIIFEGLHLCCLLSPEHGPSGFSIPWGGKANPREQVINSCMGKGWELRQHPSCSVCLHVAVPEGPLFLHTQASTRWVCQSSAFLSLIALLVTESTSASRIHVSGCSRALRQLTPQQTSLLSPPWGRHRLWATGHTSAEKVSLSWLPPVGPAPVPQCPSLYSGPGVGLQQPGSPRMVSGFAWRPVWLCDCTVRCPPVCT